MNEARTLAKAVACRFTLRRSRHGEQCFHPSRATSARNPPAKHRPLAEFHSTEDGVPNKIARVPFFHFIPLFFHVRICPQRTVAIAPNTNNGAQADIGGEKISKLPRY
jgi:hypothetical protein